jgi:hypothetical protein
MPLEDGVLWSSVSGDRLVIGASEPVTLRPEAAQLTVSRSRICREGLSEAASPTQWLGRDRDSLR